MNKKRLVLITTLILAFVLGFLTHALIFPQLFISLPGTSSNTNADDKKNDLEIIFSSSTRHVSYKKEGFSPNTVVSKKGNRLVITNQDKSTLMHLASNHPLLQNSRGYGYSEALTVVFSKEGTFEVVDKQNQKVQLKVIVLP